MPVLSGRYPLRFVTTSFLNRSETLVAELRRLQVADIAGTGTNTRCQLSNLITFVSKMVQFAGYFNAHPDLLGFELTAAYVDAYYAYLDTELLQATGAGAAGFYGAQYRGAAARAGTPAPVYSSTDLSMTFHITKYRRGGVPVPQAATLSAIRDLPYPFGWGLFPDPNNATRVDFDNHNSFDVVTLYSFGWGGMQPAARREASASIAEMLRYALSAPGTFQGRSDLDDLDCTGADSVGDCYYFLTALLDVAGYWDQSKRFWLDNETRFDFGSSAAVCAALRRHLAAKKIVTDIGLGAIRILDRACPAAGPASKPVVGIVGAPEVVYTDPSPNITMALGLEYSPRAQQVFGGFGSWHSVSAESWDSYVRPVFGPGCRNATADTGGHRRGDGRGHETAGADITTAMSGTPIYTFEASADDSSGGPAMYGIGIRPTADSGKYWWQGISVWGSTAIAAATVKFSSPLRIGIFVSTDSGLTYSAYPALPTQPGIAVHQLALPSGDHLVFRAGYTDGTGTPGLLIVSPGVDRATATNMHSAGRPRPQTRDPRRRPLLVEAPWAVEDLPAGCHGINTAAVVPGVGGTDSTADAGLVLGTYSGALAWRGGNCAAVGLLAGAGGLPTGPDPIRTTRWVALGGADVTAIASIGLGAFAALVEGVQPRVNGGGSQVVVLDRGLVVRQRVPLGGAQTGGLVVVAGAGASWLFASWSQGPYSGAPGNATVVRMPLAYVPPEL